MFSLLGLGVMAVTMADTLTVDTATCIAPIEFRAPYQTDRLDMQGKPYDAQKVMDDNAAIALAQDGFDARIGRGEALPTDTAAGAGKSTINAIRFALDADRFAKAELSVRGIRYYRTYLNGEYQWGRDLKLTPGRTEVTLLCLSLPEDRDTFRVAVTGGDLTGVALAAPSAKRAFTMDRLMEGDHYRNVALSPSGDYLVTICYNTKRDGKNVWRTVVTETASGREVWRRDGYMDVKWMAKQDIAYYTRNGAEGTEMVQLDPKTGRETVVARNMPAGSFDLAPNGEYAVYSRTLQGREELTQGLKRLEDPDDRQPGWRSRTALYRYDFKTGQMMPLTFGSASLWLNDISPDSRKLLVMYSRTDQTRLPFDRRSLVEIDAYTGEVDTIFADTIFISSGQYSPDGGELLVVGSPAAFGGIGSTLKAGQIANSYDDRLFIYDKASRKVTPMLKDFAPSIESAVWAYGDNMIYLKAVDGCDESLFRLNPKTEEVVAYELPVSYVQDFTVAVGQRNPRAVFFGQTGERAREMFCCSLSSAAKPKAKRIGDIKFEDLYGDVAVGACHDWSFLSSRGDSISGFYFLPPDFDASKKYPMIVYYYGGCTPTPKQLESHYPFQVFAGQGYVVYVCEPSGAIGFGQEFASRHVNTWGMGSADDIIEGTKAFVKAHAFVDGEKVGCIGASYGGFMTEYLQTRTDIFAAAISHAGISNIASYWGGGYWGYTYGETAQYGSFPWNNPDLYVKQSPLFNADKIHTPLLLLHGTADTNVPTNESQQLFTALRILGRPVSYVQVDGEDHVITDFKKRMVWQNAIFAWFAKWLKDQPLWWETLYPNDDFGQKK